MIGVKGAAGGRRSLAGMPTPIHPEKVHALLRAARIVVRSLAWQLSVAALLIAGCGVVFRFIEPSTPTLADGLWLAFVTASTVGYGDVIPSTHLSRAFAVVVVLLGFGVLSLITAAIAAALVGSQERRIEREILHDLHRELKSVRQELAALRHEIGERGPRR